MPKLKKLFIAKIIITAITYASRNFVTIHASTSGEKTLYLPKKCSPVEVYEEKTYGNDTDKISFSMLRGETKTFKIYE